MKYILQKMPLKERTLIWKTLKLLYSFQQFGYLSLHIGDNGDSVEVLRLFSMYRNDDDDYDNRESSDKDYYV